MLENGQKEASPHINVVKSFHWRRDIMSIMCKRINILLTMMMVTTKNNADDDDNNDDDDDDNQGSAGYDVLLCSPQHCHKVVCGWFCCYVHSCNVSRILNSVFKQNCIVFP